VTIDGFIFKSITAMMKIPEEVQNEYKPVF
jgi:hypothetical protein